MENVIAVLQGIDEAIFKFIHKVTGVYIQ